MIRIEDVKEIPRYLWNETSSKEFMMMPKEVREELIKRSTPVKMISRDDVPLLVAGLYRSSLLNVPYLWTLITSAFREAPPSTVRHVVYVANAYAPNCETLVEVGNLPAERFARAFKFKPTSGTVLFEDKEYRMYRRDA